MNCEHARHVILLAHSGELSRDRQPVLESHLAGCPACRTYRDDLARMLTVDRATPLDTDVSELTLRRISATAERTLHPAGERQVSGSFLEMWRPALLYGAAATLLLILTVTYVQRNAARIAQQGGAGATETPEELLAWDPDFDEELESLNRLLVTSVDESGTLENGDSLDSLAEELIELESWSI